MKCTCSVSQLHVRATVSVCHDSIDVIAVSIRGKRRDSKAVLNYTNRTAWQLHRYKDRCMTRPDANVCCKRSLDLNFRYRYPSTKMLCLLPGAKSRTQPRNAHVRRYYRNVSACCQETRRMKAYFVNLTYRSWR